MTAAPVRSPLQPTSKAPSTAQTNQLLAVAEHTLVASRSSSQVRRKRPVRQDPPSDDFLSERATVALIRRVLVADGNGSDIRATTQPLEAALPPLTSSNDVDIQLYAIIAIVIKDFVNTWYTKITTDHAFVDEVIQIIAHCSRALEERLRQTDVVELLLNEIPAVIEKHVVALRTANSSQASIAYGKSPQQIYHILNPHPALDPSLSTDEQHFMATTYRQLLVQGVLASLLPTEDLQNSCLRVLVTDIIADLILGRAIDDKLCESWFLHGTVSKVVETIISRTQPKMTGADMEADARGRLEKFGLLSAKADDQPHNSPKSHQSLFARWVWSTLQLLYLAFVALRFSITGMVSAHRHPARARPSSAPKSPVSKQARRELATTSGNDRSPPFILNYAAFSAGSTVLSLMRRMPWLGSFLGFWQHILTTGTGSSHASDSTIDRFLYNTLSEHIFTASLIPLALRNARAIIFPNNTLSPAAPPPPSAEDQLQIRRTAATDLLSLVPVIVKRTFFATDSEEEWIGAVEEEILDCFGDANMNRHLIYGILELIVVKLVPEMAELTPKELLGERGVEFGLENEKVTVDEDGISTYDE